MTKHAKDDGKGRTCSAAELMESISLRRVSKPGVNVHKTLKTH